MLKIVDLVYKIIIKINKIFFLVTQKYANIHTYVRDAI